MSALQGQCLSHRILTQTEAIVTYLLPQLIKNTDYLF